jgi:hypothetical protein
LRGIRYFLLLWLLFFLICFGLGYPNLKRYDPRTTGGLSDTVKYYAMTTGADQSAFRDVFRRRILVPMVARPFYWFALRLPGTWDPGFFGLLVANSLFCATTACFVVSIGTEILKDRVIALLGATLYLLSFAVPNLLLAGLVDAGEACFMAALIWTLVNEKWYLLPMLGVFGALAKETFVPFATVFAISWWLMQLRQDGEWSKRKGRQLMWTGIMGILGLATVMLVYSQVAGRFAWPWDIAMEARADVNFFMAVARSVYQPNFWYVFGWLIPLGVWRLGFFPRPWVAASIITAVTAILLGAFIDAGGSIGRSVFNICGPLLSLSVALLIARPSDSSSIPTSFEHAAG